MFIYITMLSYFTVNYYICFLKALMNINDNVYSLNFEVIHLYKVPIV